MWYAGLELGKPICRGEGSLPKQNKGTPTETPNNHNPNYPQGKVAVRSLVFLPLGFRVAQWGYSGRIGKVFS